MNFSRNFISSIDVNTLKSQINLEILILDFNSNFTENEDKCIIEVKSLKKLSCRGCGFSKVLRNHFTCVVSLVEVDLSFNRITMINDLAFDLNRNLRHLDLSGNKLQILHPLTFSKLKYLEILNLSQNLIALPKNKAFLKSTVKCVKMNENKIVDLYRESYSELNNMEALELNSNQIAVLPADVFKVNSNLKSLFIENNNLKFFPISIFDYSPLQELCVDNNNFTKNQEFFTFLNKYNDKILRTKNCNSDVKHFIENLFTSQENQSSSTLLTTTPIPTFSTEVPTSKLPNTKVSTFFIGSYISIILMAQAVAFVFLTLYLIKITKYEKLVSNSNSGNDSELNYANTILNDNDIYKVYNPDE